jgi:UPF0755 protein
MKILRWCWLLIVLVLLVIVVNQVSHWWWQQPKRTAEEQIFTIETGESFNAIAEHLKTQGLIANVFWFKVAAKVFGVGDRIQVGAYVLQPGQNYQALTTTLTQPAYASSLRVTIPEGYTLAQMGELLVNKGLVSLVDWEQVTGPDSNLKTHPLIADAKKPVGVDLEGYLFPDTYDFTPEMGAEGIARIMLDNTAAKIATLGQPVGDAQGMSLHEVLTLASIVEKEVRQPDTMKAVADIFLKRLDIGMALQADSTVNYVTGGDDPSISLEDRDNVDSPYNTYKYPGLPPGPISAPGLNAISAVINPTHNDYYYFLTTNDGQIYYARTHDEHVANKAKYLP